MAFKKHVPKNATFYCFFKILFYLQPYCYVAIQHDGKLIADSVMLLGLGIQLTI